MANSVLQDCTRLLSFLHCYEDSEKAMVSTVHQSCFPSCFPSCFQNPAEHCAPRWRSAGIHVPGLRAKWHNSRAPQSEASWRHQVREVVLVSRLFVVSLPTEPSRSFNLRYHGMTLSQPILEADKIPVLQSLGTKQVKSLDSTEASVLHPCAICRHAAEVAMSISSPLVSHCPGASTTTTSLPHGCIRALRCCLGTEGVHKSVQNGWKIIVLSQHLAFWQNCHIWNSVLTGWMIALWYVFNDPFKIEIACWIRQIKRDRQGSMHATS